MITILGSMIKIIGMTSIAIQRRQESSLLIMNKIFIQVPKITRKAVATLIYIRQLSWTNHLFHILWDVSSQIMPISVWYYFKLHNSINYSIKMTKKNHYVCSTMSKQLIELSLIKIYLLSKTLLHSVTPHKSGYPV